MTPTKIRFHEFDCPKCGYDLEDIILEHDEHDEMYLGNHIEVRCPDCYCLLDVCVDVEYILKVK